MAGINRPCPQCGHGDLDPRPILVGCTGSPLDSWGYQEIFTLKCQQCGWLGEQRAS